MKRFAVSLSLAVVFLAACSFAIPNKISLKTHALYSAHIFGTNITVQTIEESLKKAFGKNGNDPTIEDYNPPTSNGVQHYLAIKEVASFDIPSALLSGINYAIEQNQPVSTALSMIPDVQGQKDSGVAPEDMRDAMLKYQAEGALEFEQIPCYVQLVAEGGIKDKNGNDVTSDFVLDGEFAFHTTSTEVQPDSSKWSAAPKISSSVYSLKRDGNVVIDDFSGGEFFKSSVNLGTKTPAGAPTDYGVHIHYNFKFDYTGSGNLDDSSDIIVKIILFADIPMAADVVEEVVIDFSNILKGQEPFASNPNADIFQRQKPVDLGQFDKFTDAVKKVGVDVTINDVFNTNKAFLTFGDAPSKPLFLGPAIKQTLAGTSRYEIDLNAFLHTHPVPLSNFEMKFSIDNGASIYMKRGTDFKAQIDAFLETDGLIQMYPWTK